MRKDQASTVVMMDQVANNLDVLGSLQKDETRLLAIQIILWYHNLRAGSSEEDYYMFRKH